jgi:hypothetical protein
MKLKIKIKSKSKYFYYYTETLPDRKPVAEPQRIKFHLFGRKLAWQQ